MVLDEVAELKKGVAHFDAEFLGLVGACDDTAIVVGKHNDGPPHERRVEDPLAGRIEVVTIA